MTAPGFQIVAIGEVLWDLLPAGKQLGGAPANFISHAHALSARAQLISRVGDDPPGHEIISGFRKRGLPTETITVDPSAPTGTVSVNIGVDRQPRYVIHEDVAWDRLQADSAALDAVKGTDAVCFGSLAQRTQPARAAIAALLAATRPDALRIFDINLRPPFIDHDVISESLDAANVLKLNEEELHVLAQLFQLPNGTVQQLAALAGRFSLRLIALTRGREGSMLFAHGHLIKESGMAVTVRDTVGAGDSFTAAVVLGLLHRWRLEDIVRRANAIAAYVCSQSGATPHLPEELRRPFLEAPQPMATSFS